MPAKMLKKITPKMVSENVSVPYDLLEMPRPNGYVEDKHLYDLYCIVNRTRQGHNDKGVWTQFKGRFTAITPEGEVFESGGAHIPGGMMEDLLSVALDEAKAKANGQAVTIEAAFSIWIRRAPKGKPSATGYVYDVQPLTERAIAADDPIKRMIDEVSNRKNALPAPASDTGTPPASASGAGTGSGPAPTPAPEPAANKGKK